MPGPLYQPPIHHDDNGKFPWWVRAISLLLAPTVAAAYLLWFQTATITTQLGGMQEALRLHQIDAQYSLKSNDNQNVQLQAMFRLLQQICVNTARTAEDRATCWNPWR